MQDLKDVLTFHQKFELPASITPALMTEDAYKFRLGFLHEERREFDEAWRDGNLVKAVDALLDLVYVTCGTALFIGTEREWPTQDHVKRASQMNELVPLIGAPRLLPKGLQLAFSYALENRIGFFANCYSAAIIGEEGALKMSLHALRLVAIDTYVAAALMNIPWSRCWEHVQAANMAKQKAKPDGSDSARHTPWDVIKPAGWIAPDAKIAMELQVDGWRVPGMMLVDNMTGKVEMLNV